ncbi:MAG: aminotransferase class V-fold PLP-dependent enzyme, partial [Lachnospiraceae bacterium]|nr:aminotransferase class V-fold PLP-dependent enzyme [Lachnospiraceae bacterium]
MLDANGICASAGSACRSHESKPSHVLTAMGLTADEARSSVRVSFSKYNTLDEADRAAEIFANCIASLRGIETK